MIIDPSDQYLRDLNSSKGGIMHNYLRQLNKLYHKQRKKFHKQQIREHQQQEEKQNQAKPKSNSNSQSPPPQQLQRSYSHN